MLSGIPIGRVFGISLKLHYSWFFIFGLVTWALAANYFPTVYPNWTPTMKIAAGLITSFLFFGSVLGHEIMHSLVALREKIPVHSITLFALGGVSQMTEEPKQPKDEFRMAIAGPASSIVLGGIFGAIYFTTRGNAAPAYQFVTGIAYWLGLINVSLGVFNLIPGFPLDGGRVLRSLLWWRSHNLQSATKAASTVGRVFGFLFIGVGIWLMFTGNLFNGIWLALIGWFLESAASGSYRQLLLQELLKGHVASEVMSRDCSLVAPDLPLERLVNEQILGTGRRCFPVSAEGRIQGIVGINEVRAVARDRWSLTRVRDVMIPLERLKSVTPDADLNSVLQILAEDNINQVPVVQDKSVVGVVARDNIVNFINLSNQVGSTS